MTFFALIRNAHVNLATNKLVLPAEDVATFLNTIELGNELKRLVEESAESIKLQEQRGFEVGYEEGKTEGKVAAQKELAEKLMSLSRSAAYHRENLRASVVKLAIQVVRKVAGEIGAPEVVAGLADVAAKELVPDVSLCVRVHPAAVDKVSAQLEISLSNNAGQPVYFDVRADESLDQFDCIIDTPFGSTIASLEDQLNRLEASIKQAHHELSPIEACKVNDMGNSSLNNNLPHAEAEQ